MEIGKSATTIHMEIRFSRDGHNVGAWGREESRRLTCTATFAGPMGLRLRALASVGTD